MAGNIATRSCVTLQPQGLPTGVARPPAMGDFATAWLLETVASAGEEHAQRLAKEEADQKLLAAVRAHIAKRQAERKK